MTEPTKPAQTKRAATRAANRPDNPFLDAETHGRMRDYTERESAIAKELKAIVERGAGRRSLDPRMAPSLKPLREMVKKGLPLWQMFDRMVQGVEKGLWEPWMAAYGMELKSVSYTAARRNACISIDMSAGAKAGPLFAKAGVHNWRSLLADDCAELTIVKPGEKTPFLVAAVFYLDPAS